jgi:hypothetical protein
MAIPLRRPRRTCPAADRVGFESIVFVEIRRDRRVEPANPT